MSTIALIITAIGAVGSLVIFLVFFKQNKRIKHAEANKKEYDLLSDIIDEIKKDRDSLRVDVNRLEKRINDFEISYIEIEKENHIYKRAGNAGFSCEIPRDKCPIHLKFYELKNSKNDNTSSPTKD